MPLEDNHTTIKARYEHLHNYIKNAPLGPIPQTDFKMLKQFYAKYYVPGEEQIKQNAEEFTHARTEKSSYGGPRLRFYLSDKSSICCILRNLAGSGKTEDANLIRAMHNAIQPQIDQFIKDNPLNPEAICPKYKRPLGQNVKVGHHNPSFLEIATKFLEENPKPTIRYLADKNKFIINSETTWYEYHQQKANLHYLSI